MDVKRLAAIDMFGTTGTIRRRRIILAEFVVGLVAMVALGAWLVATASGVGARVVGIWLIGAGVNYAPLTAYAICLSRSGALDAELADVDINRELRRYSILQVWIAVPLSLVTIALTAAWRKPGT